MYCSVSLSHDWGKVKITSKVLKKKEKKKEKSSLKIIRTEEIWEFGNKKNALIDMKQGIIF